MIPMCKMNTLDNAPMSHKRYSTWERNQAQGLKQDCSGCSARRQKKCKSKNLKAGTPSNKMSPKKLPRALRLAEHPTSPEIRGKMINRRQGIAIEETFNIKTNQFKYKIIPVMYGRTADRWGKAIHE